MNTITLHELIKLLDVSEDEAIKAILTLISPPPPPATRQNWTRLTTFGNSAPSTKELWHKLVESDFRCIKCSSQMRLSFNHINGNAQDHQLNNLEVICFSCNREVSNKGTKDKDQHFKLVISVIKLWKENKKFPELELVRQNVNVEQIGGATYLLKFLKKRLESKNK